MIAIDFEETAQHQAEQMREIESRSGRSGGVDPDGMTVESETGGDDEVDWFEGE